MTTEKATKLLEHGLKDMYDAEHRFADALVKMAKNAKDETLADGFRRHREVTQRQAERLEQAFREMGLEPKRQTCAAAKGLVEEYEHFVQQEGGGDGLIDAFSATAALKVEHYEIASYRSMIDLAEFCDLDGVSKLLKQNLMEEERTAAEVHSQATNLGAQLAGVSAAKVAGRAVGAYIDTVRTGTFNTLGSAGAVVARATGRVREAGERARKSQPKSGTKRSTAARRATSAARTTRRKAKTTARKAKSTARKAKSTARKATRTTARKTKGTARKATRSTKSTARTGTRKAKGTARKAKSTARKATGRARTSTRSTAKAAKRTARRSGSAARRSTGARKTGARKRSTARRRTSR